MKRGVKFTVAPFAVSAHVASSSLPAALSIPGLMPLESDFQALPFSSVGPHLFPFSSSSRDPSLQSSHPAGVVSPAASSSFAFGSSLSLPAAGQFSLGRNSPLPVFSRASARPVRSVQFDRLESLPRAVDSLPRALSSFPSAVASLPAAVASLVTSLPAVPREIPVSGFPNVDRTARQLVELYQQYVDSQHAAGVANSVAYATLDAAISNAAAARAAHPVQVQSSLSLLPSLTSPAFGATGLTLLGPSVQPSLSLGQASASLNAPQVSAQFSQLPTTIMPSSLGIDLTDSQRVNSFLTLQLAVSQPAQLAVSQPAPMLQTTFPAAAQLPEGGTGDVDMQHADENGDDQYDGDMLDFQMAKIFKPPLPLTDDDNPRAWVAANHTWFDQVRMYHPDDRAYYLWNNVPFEIQQTIERFAADSQEYGPIIELQYPYLRELIIRALEPVDPGLTLRDELQALRLRPGAKNTKSFASRINRLMSQASRDPSFAMTPGEVAHILQNIMARDYPEIAPLVAAATIDAPTNVSRMLVAMTSMDISARKLDPTIVQRRGGGGGAGAGRGPRNTGGGSGGRRRQNG